MRAWMNGKISYEKKTMMLFLSIAHSHIYFKNLNVTVKARGKI